MKLPIQLPFKKKDDKEYYLCLLLSNEKTHATVFAEDNGKIDVIGEKEEHFLLSLEKLSDEQLLDILDKTISSAESSLPEGFQTRKTIFGVKENWIEDNKIKKVYLEKLKKVCDALGLTPIGFLVTHEAIAHLLQKEEGAPVSAILVEDGTHEVAISILRAGKLLETKRIPKEDTVAKIIDKALLHFTHYEILPSRIILFHVKEHEKLSQDLIAHQWSKSIPFLHVPQVKILPNTFEKRALLFGAATQMGFEVVDKFDKPTIPLEKPIQQEIQDEKETSAITDGDNFGFIADTDVAQKENSKKVLNNPVDEKDSEEEDSDETIEAYNQEFFSSEHEKVQTSQKQKKLLITLHHMKNKMNHLFRSLSHAVPLTSITSRFPILGKNKGIIFIPPAIIAIALLLFLLYIFQLKATVVVTINPKTVEKTQDITFSTKEASDPSRNVIAAEIVSTSLDGTESTSATGKKEIGEKAKGNITFYNSTTKEQTITKGTTITSSNNLQFILDDTVKIASSGGASDGAKTAKGNVTAKDIGKEFNLPSGTKFTISGFSSSEVEGKNENAFSGGSKEEITVVAKADQTKLLNELPKQLEEKAKNDLETKVDDTKAILPLFLSVAIDKKKFDKNIGDEAPSVTLNGSVVFDSAAYTKSDMDLYAYETLSSDSTDLSPAKETISYTLNDIKDANGDISAKVAIKGFLLPKVDKQAIAEKITAKSFEEAEVLIAKMPQVKQVTIALSPNLPFLPQLLPRISNNITVEVATNE